jgi:hypothetical protein
MGDRVGMEIEDFIRFFEDRSRHRLEDLRSPLRRPALAQARIELATLAATRYGLRSTDLARYIQKFRRRLRVGSAWRSASIGARSDDSDDLGLNRLDRLT